jgi:predicted dehydrogenase
MIHAEETNPGFIGIGYQWSFSPAIQMLKYDIMNGVLGKPLRFRTKILWPRTSTYYQRNAWAGRIKNASGTWILDSPANNATAHYLHNCLYVLGSRRETSAILTTVQAELYRANQIENYDTAAIRCYTDEGVEILFYTAHPVRHNIGPILSYEFENAVVKFSASEKNLIAHFHDGHVKDYGNPSSNDAIKLWDAVNAVRTGEPLACGVQAANAHTLCINGAQESVNDIAQFPAHLIQRTGIEDGMLTWVAGLQETLESCYKTGKLPAEDPNVAWARGGHIVNLRSYTTFPSR